MNAPILAAALLAVAVAAEETPTPTPTPTRAPVAKSLAEAARSSQTEKPDSGSEPVVITDQNLQEYAEKGRLTTADGGTSGRRPLKQEGPSQGPAPSEGDEASAQYRAAYMRQVELIETLQSQIAVLDETIPGLWTQFYNVDDPAYRDGVIKPKLDEALLRRQRLETQLQDALNRLPQILDEARRAGVAPSWSRGLPRAEDLERQSAPAEDEDAPTESVTLP